MNRLSCLALAAFATIAPAATAVAASGAPVPERYYTVEDFARVPKIDTHVHLHGAADRFMAEAIRDNIRVLTINVDYPDFPPLAEQEHDAVSLRQRYPGRVAFAASFTMDGFGAPRWAETTTAALDAAFRDGAVAVKIWKNIGMAVRDATGAYVMPDDPKLAPVIARLERQDVVLLGHQAEPLNCWLAPEAMTVASDREYFAEHPAYYMYRHPEMPTHEAILSARDRMLAAHPKLRFVGVHLASLEWDVDKVAGFLERFPTAKVDVAARMVHLEYQATKDPDKVRRFLIRYQDRILYGSDDAYGPDDSKAAAIADVRDGWRADWKFLVTGERLHSPDFKASYRGLHLPRAVVAKIYRLNAESTFAGAWRDR